MFVLNCVDVPIDFQTADAQGGNQTPWFTVPPFTHAPHPLFGPGPWDVRVRRNGRIIPNQVTEPHQCMVLTRTFGTVMPIVLNPVSQLPPDVDLERLTLVVNCSDQGLGAGGSGDFPVLENIPPLRHLALLLQGSGPWELPLSQPATPAVELQLVTAANCIVVTEAVGAMTPVVLPLAGTSAELLTR